MKKIVLLSCGKKKVGHRTQAQSLYVGSLFAKSIAYARQLNPDAIFILSAKHGVLELDDELEPYDQTLVGMDQDSIRRWSEKVLIQLSERSNLAEDHFTFLAGGNYRRYLEPHLVHTSVPLRGLTIGRQLQFLEAQLR